MASVTHQPASFAMRESGASLMIAILLLTAPAAISLFLHHQ